MPMTFELPSEFLMFVEEHGRNPGSTWIIKPVWGSQGRGIYLFQKLNELKKLMKKIGPKTGGAMIENYIVQRYIDNPYLLDGALFMIFDSIAFMGKEMYILCDIMGGFLHENC